jgi:hypothetical protein
MTDLVLVGRLLLLVNGVVAFPVCVIVVIVVACNNVFFNDLICDFIIIIISFIFY